MPGALRRARATASSTTRSSRTPSVTEGQIASGQLDQIVDQGAELLGLLDHVGQHVIALVGLELAAGQQHLDVGAQARHRGAELVRGVGDELALGTDRFVEVVAGMLEALEHRVEARGQLSDLVVGMDVDAAAEILGLADVLGGLGHLGQRREDPARGGAPERGGEGDAARAQQDEDRRAGG